MQLLVVLHIFGVELVLYINIFTLLIKPKHELYHVDLLHNTVRLSLRQQTKESPKIFTESINQLQEKKNTLETAKIYMNTVSGILYCH